MRRIKRLSAFLLAFLIPFTALSGFVYAEEVDYTLKVINNTTLYSENDLTSSAVAPLSADAVVTLLEDSQGGWAKVKCEEGTGYCLTSMLDKTEDSEVKLIARTKAYINFRKTPEISNNLIETIDEELCLDISNNSNPGWSLVVYNGVTGYLSKDYIEVIALLSNDVPPTNDFPNWFEEAPATVKSIFFENDKLTLTNADTAELTVFSDTGAVMNNLVKFTSSLPEAVSVDPLGHIEAKAEGTAVITASLYSDPSVTAKCEVQSKKSVVPPLNVTDYSIKLSANSASMYVGNKFAITAVSQTEVKWTSSNSSTASVSNGIVTANAAGKATITANNGYNSATCEITVSKGASVNISSTESTVTVGKTLFLQSTSHGAKWSSTNTDIATVKQMTDKNGVEFAFILAKKEGNVAVKISNSSGASTCLVKVTAAEPVRFAYTTPNSAPAGSDVSFIAITDLNSTAVKFEYKMGETSATVNASNRTVDGNTAIWTATTPLKTAGTYTVKAYSKKENSEFATCPDAETTAFVTATDDTAKTSCETRRASDKLISILASFEGYIPDIYLDPATGSDPTVGYGRVVTPGLTFYNSITQREAMAYLYKTVNSSGYSEQVNAYMLKNEIKFNQQQFDALVCFAYNLGAYALTTYDGINNMLLNTYPDTGKLYVGAKGKITGTYVNFRTGPSTGYQSLTQLDINTPVTLLSTEIFNSNWYYVELENGSKGYVYGDYIAFTEAKGQRDLNNIKSSEFIKTFMAYHHAGSQCLWGLVYRRLDEAEMFLNGDYEQDGRSNKFGYHYTCSRNPSIKI